jgi:hypothetical protein
MSNTTKLRITKNQATHIATLINTCAAYTILVNSEIAKGQPQPSLVRDTMVRHDEVATELNTLLGTTAIHLYITEAV